MDLEQALGPPISIYVVSFDQAQPGNGIASWPDIRLLVDHLLLSSPGFFIL